MVAELELPDTEIGSLQGVTREFICLYLSNFVY